MAQSLNKIGAAEVAGAARGSIWRRKQVQVVVAHARESSVRCPQCQRACIRYDHAAERQWRHLNVMQFTTIIHARAPRWQCLEHGVVTVATTRAEPHGRFTLFFEAFAVGVIAASRSFSQAVEILRLHWHTVESAYLARQLTIQRGETTRRRRNPKIQARPLCHFC